jgi:hypothetical protein
VDDPREVGDAIARGDRTARNGPNSVGIQQRERESSRVREFESSREQRERERAEKSDDPTERNNPAETRDISEVIHYGKAQVAIN